MSDLDRTRSLAPRHQDAGLVSVHALDIEQSQRSSRADSIAPSDDPMRTTDFLGEYVSTPSANRISRTFADYELLERIGQGGMGVVYKARQRSLSRIVALKMIRSGQFASEIEIKRFLSEATSTASLNHPGIVPVYEAGHVNGQHYFSMAFVEGFSLQQLVDEETELPQRDIAEIVRRIALAVDFAHQHNIIHRDLKPSNVMLARSGGDFSLALPGKIPGRIEPMVVDFGLAKLQSGESAMTCTGDVLGTPSYMSPEQVEGNSSVLSDVYALGGILYCMMTGHAPFVASTPLKIIELVVHQDPLRPSLQCLVAKDLETICLKCLEKCPTDRYASAADLANDLQRFCDGLPIHARVVGRAERSVKWLRRHPTLTSLMCVATVALLSLIALGVTQLFLAARSQQLYYRNTLAAHLAFQSQDLVGARHLLDQCPASVQEWEWGYVNRLCAFGLRKVLVDAKEGQKFSTNKGIRIFVIDSNSGERIGGLDCNKLVLGIRFADVAGHLEVVLSDRSVQRWNYQTGQLVDSRPGKIADIQRIALSSDGKLLACQVHPMYLAGKEMFALSKEDWVLAVQAEHAGAVNRIVHSVDAAKFVSACEHGHVKLWDAADRRVIREFSSLRNATAHSGPTNDVAFDSTGSRLVTCGADLHVRVWDVTTGRLLLDFDHHCGHTRTIYGAIFAPNDQRLVTVGADVKVISWDVGAHSECRRFSLTQCALNCLDYACHGELIVAGDEIGKLHIIDPRTGTSSQLQAHSQAISDVCYLPNRGWIATSSFDNTIKLWKLSQGELSTEPVLDQLDVLEAHTGRVYGISLDPTESFLASCAHDGRCIIWRIEDRIVQAEHRSQAGPIRTVAFDSTGQTLVLGGYELSTWDFRRKHTRSFRPPSSATILAAGFNRSGDQLFSAGQDGLVHVWSPSGGLRRSLQINNSKVHSLCVNPSGSRLATGGSDGAIRIWDYRSNYGTLQLGSGSSINDIVFGSDASTVAAVHSDGSLSIWGKDDSLVSLSKKER